MLYASLGILSFALQSVVGVQNDTKMVGSFIHELKIKPPHDLLGAASKKHATSGDKFGDEGHIKSKATKDDDGFSKFDTYHTKDGDSYGYAQHFEFDKKGGDKKNGGYQQTSNFDEDEAADSVKPKYSEWHFEENSDSPSKYYRYENDGEKGSKGKLVGPGYQSETKKSKKRPKRKKEQDAAATEYENYDTYGDVEEADDGAAADFEAEDADPEYANVYADAEAYDYY